MSDKFWQKDQSLFGSDKKCKTRQQAVFFDKMTKTLNFHFLKSLFSIKATFSNWFLSDTCSLWWMRIAAASKDTGFSKVSMSCLWGVIDGGDIKAPYSLHFVCKNCSRALNIIPFFVVPDLAIVLRRHKELTENMNFSFCLTDTNLESSSGVSKQPTNGPSGCCWVLCEWRVPWIHGKCSIRRCTDGEAEWKNVATAVRRGRWGTGM